MVLLEWIIRCSGLSVRLIVLHAEDPVIVPPLSGLLRCVFLVQGQAIRLI